MSRCKGFTLIELLVVVSIIALLVSILVPSLQQARELADRAVCATNQHGIVLAVTVIGDAYEGDLPRIYGAECANFVYYDDPSNPDVSFDTRTIFEDSCPPELFYCPGWDMDPSDPVMLYGWYPKANDPDDVGGWRNPGPTSGGRELATIQYNLFFNAQWIGYPHEWTDYWFYNVELNAPPPNPRPPLTEAYRVPKNLRKLSNHAETVLVADQAFKLGGNWSREDPKWSWSNAHHGGTYEFRGVNAGMADGHVEWRDSTYARARAGHVPGTTRWVSFY